MTKAPNRHLPAWGVVAKLGFCDHWPLLTAARHIHVAHETVTEAILHRKTICNLKNILRKQFIFKHMSAFDWTGKIKAVKIY